MGMPCSLHAKLECNRTTDANNIVFTTYLFQFLGYTVKILIIRDNYFSY